MIIIKKIGGKKLYNYLGQTYCFINESVNVMSLLFMTSKMNTLLVMRFKFPLHCHSICQYWTERN